MSMVSSRRFNLPLWLVGLFVAYSLMLVWSNYNSQQQIRASSLHEFNLQAEQRAAALTDFFATRRADLLELAELNELAGFFANRDLQMSMEYGLRINLLAIEAGFRRVMARKQTAGRAIYDSIVLVDHAGQLLASAGTGLPADFDARRLLTRERDQVVTLFDALAHRLVTTAPVYYKDKPVGQIITFINISLFERYYLQSNSLDAWNEVLVDAQGVPVFGLSPHLVDMQKAKPVIQQMKSGVILQLGRQLGPENAFSGEGVLLVKWAIEGSPYHLLTLIPPDMLDQRLTSPIYLIAAGSVPLIVLFSLLYFRHMQQINQELVNRYRESDRKRDELAGKFSALELEIQRREAVELELRRKGQELEERSKELQSANAAASHLARYDSLTGLSNRMMYREALQHSILLAQRENRRLAVLFLDLDHFKRVNDSLGHSVGDRLLQEIAHRLVNCIRETDNIARAADDSEGWHVARQGGDEFTILLNNVEQTFVVAHVASRIIEAMTQPLLVAGHNLLMTCSIGISVYPEDGLDADSLLKNADTAMYSAKEGGRNKYQFFEAAMQAGIMQRLELDTDLAQALDRGQLIVHYQPIAHAADCRIFACEALLRWHHPTKGWIPPSEFIPLAEESGQIIPITNFVLAHAAQQARHWLNSAGWTPRIAVNLSGRVLDLVDVPLMMASALRAGPSNTSWLELELTESTLMQKYDSVRGILDSLRELNVSISIDDFGTGYSSLAYLKAFPIDTLKIDRSFVIDLPHDSDSTAIVRAIIALAHSLNLEVIAEGVETEEQLAFLNAAGCEYVQGYLIGKPAAAETLTIAAA